jgi:hypothetical protein
MSGLTHTVTADRRARPITFGALIAAALMLVLPAFSTGAGAAESKPTIVLVHGAFASLPGGPGSPTPCTRMATRRRRRRWA